MIKYQNPQQNNSETVTNENDKKIPDKISKVPALDADPKPI